MNMNKNQRKIKRLCTQKMKDINIYNTHCLGIFHMKYFYEYAKSKLFIVYSLLYLLFYYQKLFQYHYHYFCHYAPIKYYH